MEGNLEERVSIAVQFIGETARVARRFMEKKKKYGYDCGLEENFLNSYEICRHNGCANSEFKVYFPDCARAMLSMFPPPFELVPMGAGAIFLYVGVVDGSVLPVVVGSVLAGAGVYGAYRRFKVWRHHKSLFKVLDCLDSQPELYDFALERLKNG